MKIPTIIKQNETIKEIKNFLNMFKDCSCSHSLLLKYGSSYLINKYSLSSDPIGTPKQCYMNAFNLMESDHLTYVEGYCHIGILPIEHAWCVNKKGKVIDPTLKIDGSKFNPCGYFGIPFKEKYVYETALKTKMFGIINYTNKELLLGKIKPETFLES